MKMRTIIAACFIVASPAVSRAADLPKKQMPLPPALVKANWEGFYAGIHAGAAWGRTSATDKNPLNGNPSFGAPFSAPLSGFLGGVQAGYNWQKDVLVAGVEADFGYLGLNGSKTYSLALQNQAPAPPPPCNNIRGCAPPPPPGPLFSPTSLRTDGGPYATLRGRLGIASGNFLFFATGGLFAADLNSHLASYDGMLVTGKTGWGLGWTAGAGVEVAMSEKLRLKVDYLHFAMGSQQVTGTVNGAVRPFNIKHKGDLVRIGLNYRF